MNTRVWLRRLARKTIDARELRRDPPALMRLHRTMKRWWAELNHKERGRAKRNEIAFFLLGGDSPTPKAHLRFKKAAAKRKQRERLRERKT